MFHPSKPLGLRGNSFQGSSYYAAENPPIAAVFTYYIQEDIKTLKAERREMEKEHDKSGREIGYPPLDRVRAEDDEIKPHLIFTIYDQQGNVIRKLEAEAKKGIHRIAWDFRYPATSPAQIQKPEFDNPFSDPERGPLALPGTYAVSLSKFEGGKVTEISQPVRFTTRLLSNTTLPAEDKEALFDFQEKVGEFQRVATITVQVLDELTTKLKYFYVAVNNTTGIPADLTDRVASLDQRLKDLDRILNGDASLSNRDFPAAPSVMSRINTIVSGLWSSTSAPTQTQKASLETAMMEFEKAYADIREITDVEIREIESILEKSGAPWTPGRLPEWKKQ